MMFTWCCVSSADKNRQVDQVSTIKVLVENEAEEVLENCVGSDPANSGEPPVALETVSQKASAGPPLTLSEEKTATSLAAREPSPPAATAQAQAPAPAATETRAPTATTTTAAAGTTAAAAAATAAFPATWASPASASTAPGTAAADVSLQESPANASEEAFKAPPGASTTTLTTITTTSSRGGSPSPPTKSNKAHRSASSTPRTGSKGSKSGTFEVTLERKDGRSELGLDVGRADYAIKIKKVVAGLVEDHNRQNPALAIQAKDLIVAVNGTRGTANQLLKAVSTADPAVLTIRRP